LYFVIQAKFKTLWRRDNLGILSGNPKDEPLHDGEVFGVWSFITANNGLLSVYQAFINHAGDKDLKDDA
jgi:hypothetical protein